jgi:hypothetical protein
MAHDRHNHAGFERTYQRLRQSYFLKGGSSIIRDYIRHCPSCLINCHGARRIKARMVDYGCCAHMRARLCSLISLAAYLFGYLRGLAVAVLPAVVRVDVVRGTHGIVVWVNVVRVLCCCVRVAYMRGMPTVFGFLSFLFFLTQPLFLPPPPHRHRFTLRN